MLNALLVEQITDHPAKTGCINHEPGPSAQRLFQNRADHVVDHVGIRDALELVREDDGALPRPKRLPPADPQGQALVMDADERRVVLCLREIDA